MPLYHFVTGDLPANTVAPELDDTNATAVLAADGMTASDNTPANVNVNEELLGTYLAYLVAAGFLPAPREENARPLPSSVLSEEQLIALKNVGGRGAMV
jgi:L-aminoadipate-semialdehyde dehydrogenase